MRGVVLVPFKSGVFTDVIDPPKSKYYTEVVTYFNRKNKKLKLKQYITYIDELKLYIS